MRKVGVGKIKWLSRSSGTGSCRAEILDLSAHFFMETFPICLKLARVRWPAAEGEGPLISSMTNCKLLTSLTSVPKGTIRRMVTICSPYSPEAQREKLAYSGAIRKQTHALFIRQVSAKRVVGHWDKFLIKYLIFMEFSIWVHRIFHCILAITL